MIQATNIHEVFDISNLVAIWHIFVDEILRQELIDEFNNCTIQSGKDIFRKLYDIILHLVFDTIADDHVFSCDERENLLESLLSKSNTQNSNLLMEMFLAILIKEYTHYIDYKGNIYLVNLDYFISNFIKHEDLESFTSFIRSLKY